MLVHASSSWVLATSRLLPSSQMVAFSGGTAVGDLETSENGRQLLLLWLCGAGWECCKPWGSEAGRTPGRTLEAANQVGSEDVGLNCSLIACLLCDLEQDFDPSEPLSPCQQNGCAAALLNRYWKKKERKALKRHIAWHVISPPKARLESRCPFCVGCAPGKENPKSPSKPKDHNAFVFLLSMD